MKASVLPVVLFTLFLSFGVYANSIICENTPHQDITSVKIVSYQGDVFVTEFGQDYEEQLNSVTTESIDGEFSQELSDWNGYTRVLSRDAQGEVTITTSDECSSDTTTLHCTQLE